MREARARRGALRKPRGPAPDLPSFGLAHVPRPRPSSFHSCAPICETYNTRAREHVGSYVWRRRLLAEVRVARPFSNFCHESSVPRGTRQRGPLLGKRPLSLLPRATLARSHTTPGCSFPLVLTYAPRCRANPWHASLRKFAAAPARRGLPRKRALEILLTL